VSNLYLISSEVNSVTTYYTANSNGTLISIGNTLDFTKGFTKDILNIISNSVYSTLTNGKIWTDSTTVGSASIDTTGGGFITTTDETAINTKGYSGISSFNAVASGDVRFGLSFSGNTSFMAREPYIAISSNSLLPSSIADRAKIVTINNTYDNLFDNNESTSYSSALTTNNIPMEFASAHILRKFTGKLTSNSILPVTVTLQIYDTASSSYKDLGKLIVNTTDPFSQTFDNSVSATKYQFKIEYTSDGSGKGIDIAELNLNEQETDYNWVPCSNTDLPTKGITVSDLNSLTALDTKSIFNNTQLDYNVYVPEGASFTSLVVSFPANTAPSVTNFVVNPNSPHAEDAVISFNVVDLEKMDTTYTISVNGKELVSTTATPSNGSVSNISVPNANLIIGSNLVAITVADELNASATYNFTITKVDSLPTYVGTLVGHDYTFNIADADGDKVKYKTTLNGTELEAETDLAAVPLSHTTHMQTNKIKIGETNTLLVTITDSLGGVTTITETFTGAYYGILFSDEKGNYLTTDVGDLLKYLDFGAIIAGYNSLAKEIKITNMTSNPISSLVISTPGALNTAGTITAKLSSDDTFTSSVTSLPINNLNPNGTDTFYLRLEASDKTAIGDFTFAVNGAGKY
jgi:hypothetical protein